MRRYHSWEPTLIGDYWTQRFRPKDLLRATAYAQSVLARRYDEGLLERYDINDLVDHTVGYTYSWVPIKLDPPTYVEGDDYPYKYEIDPGWIDIEAIYESHIDPKDPRQYKIDYEYVGKSGILQFMQPIPEENLDHLYISKGHYAGYRIYNEIGCLLDYLRTDSLFYRDSIDPILSAFYKGPTIRNLNAILNYLVGYPVAKYGDETVKDVKGSIVTTDKYSYNLRNMPSLVKEGDILYKYQPLCSAISIKTHTTDPYWWLKKPADLFAKYKTDGPMTTEIKDYIMGTFLYDAVAYIYIDMNYVDPNVISDNEDILNLFYLALPTRTDIFLSESQSVASFDDGTIMDPKVDPLLLRPHYFSLWGSFNSLKKYYKLNPGEISPNTHDAPYDFCNSEMLFCSDKLGRPHWIEDPNVIYKTASEKNMSRDWLHWEQRLTLDDYHWHIFDDTEANPDNNYRGFMRFGPQKPSTFEPCYDRIYLKEIKGDPSSIPEVDASVEFVHIATDESGHPIRIRVTNTQVDSKGRFTGLDSVPVSEPNVKSITTTSVRGGAGVGLRSTSKALVEGDTGSGAGLFSYIDAPLEASYSGELRNIKTVNKSGTVSWRPIGSDDILNVDKLRVTSSGKATWSKSTNEELSEVSKIEIQGLIESDSSQMTSWELDNAILVPHVGIEVEGTDANPYIGSFVTQEYIIGNIKKTVKVTPTCIISDKSTMKCTLYYSQDKNKAYSEWKLLDTSMGYASIPDLRGSIWFRGVLVANDMETPYFANFVFELSI